MLMLPDQDFRKIRLENLNLKCLENCLVSFNESGKIVDIFEEMKPNINSASRSLQKIFLENFQVLQKQ